MSGLPEEWVSTSIKELGIVASGGTPKSKVQEYWEGEIPWVTPADLSGYNQKTIVRGRRNITEKGLSASSAVLLPKNSILFSSRAPVGYTVIASTEMATNQGFKNLIPVPSVHVDYVYHYLKGNKALAESFASGTTFLELSGTNFGKLPIPLSPLNEQHRIVNKIEELFTKLDAGVASLKKAQKLLKQYRQSVLKAAFEGKLTEEWRKEQLADPESPLNKEPASVLLEKIKAERRRKWEEAELAKMTAKGKVPKDDKWKDKYVNKFELDAQGLPELPEGWVWAKVGLAGKVQLGRQRSPKNHNGPNMRPYLRVANVFEERINISDIMEMNFTEEEFQRFKLDDQDILLNEGQSLELVGRPAIYRDELPGSCFTNTLVRFKAEEGILPIYSLAVFLSYFHRGDFMKIARWTTSIAHLGADRFAQMLFPIPSVSEQEIIVYELDKMKVSIDKCTDEIRREIIRTEALRQSILKSAFLGNLVEQDPNDEPASVLLERIKEEKAKLEVEMKAQKKKARGKG
jgi:type I restriction enzyme S subunit